MKLTDKRTEQIHFRITKADKDLLVSICDRYGLTVAECLVMCVENIILKDKLEERKGKVIFYGNS